MSLCDWFKKIFGQINESYRTYESVRKLKDTFREIPAIDFYIGTKCSICNLKIAKSHLIIHLDCNHYYHKKCIDEWLEKKVSCPLCLQTGFNCNNGEIIAIDYYTKLKCSICDSEFIEYDIIKGADIDCKKHIFHKICIDPLLKEGTDLCPVCYA